MRAFTMLEMLLAVSLAGLLMLVCVGLFVTVERTDRALEVRHTQAEEMSTVHRVMDRAFSTMLMATDAQVAAEAQNRSGVQGGEYLSVSRPRLLLEQDAAAAAMGLTVQRLEVVLSRAPVPPGFGREWAATDIEREMAGPVRGVFELRTDPEGDGMAMWWRPLPRDENEFDGHRYHLDPREDEFAVRLGTGLTEAKWLAFKSRERQPLIEAKVSHDLPAHMELHVQMSSGYAAQWMFEVQWINGAETPEERAAEEEEEAMEELIPGGVQRRGGTGAGPGTGETGTGAGTGTRRGPGSGTARPGTGGRNTARPSPADGVDRAPR